MLQSETVKKYDTYKDSGIEWIGEIPQDWRILPHKHILSKVKNICEKYAGEDIISLTMKGVIKRDLDNPMGKMPLTFDGYQRIEAGNLLLCLFDIDVTPRCVGLIKNNGLTSPAYSQFEFLGLDCPQYYTYLLTMIDDDKCFLHLAKNLRSSLTEDNFGAILTIQPTVKEQQAIADYLDKKCGEIDRVVETEKSVIEKLKEYKQSIITEAVTKGLDKSVPLKDSGIEWIGKIPQHWEMLNIGNTIKFEGGTQPSLEYFSDELKDGYIRLVQTRDYRTSDYMTYVPMDMVRRFCDEKDVMIGRYGPPIFQILRGLVGAYNVALIKAIPMGVDREYMYYFLQQKELHDYVESMSQRASGQTGIDPKKLRKYPFPMPPSVREQQQIAEYLDNKCSEIDNAIADKEQLIEKFTEYKKSLIYECVTGKRKVVT